VLRALVWADLRARYGRGRLRMLKWIMDPFALVGVYLVLITLLRDRPGEAPGLSLACAVIAFQVVMLGVANAMTVVKDRSTIVLNMGFERRLLPVSSTLTEAIGFGASLALLGLMMAIYGIAPTLAALWLPVVLAVTVAFAIACSYPASLFGLIFNDLRPFAISVVRAMFFLAPGLVPLSEISGQGSELIKLNPLTGLFESYRDALLYGTSPEAWQLLYPLGITALLLAIFLPLYQRAQRSFAKML